MAGLTVDARRTTITASAPGWPEAPLCIRLKAAASVAACPTEAARALDTGVLVGVAIGVCGVGPDRGVVGPLVDGPGLLECMVLVGVDAAWSSSSPHTEAARDDASELAAVLAATDVTADPLSPRRLALTCLA